MRKIFYVFIVIIILLSTYSYAHKGRTDSNGGHYDRSTGEYHYHHGYPAHQHINGVCPYDYNSKRSVEANSKPTKVENTIINEIENKSLTNNTISKSNTYVNQNTQATQKKKDDDSGLYIGAFLLVISGILFLNLKKNKKK